MRRWLVWDTETTGLPVGGGDENLNRQPRIIELGIIEVVENQVTREHSWLFNPGVALSEEVQKITGLKDGDLEHAPTFAECFQDITLNWFLGAHGMCAHNLPFDRSMLVFELKRLGKEYAFPYPPEQICSVQTFQHLAGRRINLKDLYQRITGKELNWAHRALDDTRALVEILTKEQVLV
jgi:ATP-dependent DNA helicase DinG